MAVTLGAARGPLSGPIKGESGTAVFCWVASDRWDGSGAGSPIYLRQVCGTGTGAPCTGFGYVSAVSVDGRSLDGAVCAESE